MKPEIYFLRYAFPCSHVLCKIRKEISEEEYKKIERAAIKGIILDRKYLEKVFFRAFERIEKIAAELKTSKWDINVLREYFVERHNAFVNSSVNPEKFKELCRVHKAKIIEVKENPLTVKYNNKKREVKKVYVPDAEKNDIVTIHYNYAVEKV